MYVDFAGDCLEVTDANTGEVRSVEVFVAILPCSQYTYCEAVWSQRKEEFAAFAEFYNCAVYPARVRHPKDKALVENAVKLMYRSVYADLEGKVFHDLASLNEAILQSLDSFNRHKLTGRKGSRRELFEETEKDYLQELRPRKSIYLLLSRYVVA